jgi:hypothetical protein
MTRLLQHTLQPEEKHETRMRELGVKLFASLYGGGMVFGHLVRSVCLRIAFVCQFVGLGD